MFRFSVNKERRVILIIGGILLLCGIGYRMMPVFQFSGEKQSELEIKQKQIIKYQRKIQNKDLLEKKRLALTRGAERLKRGVLKGQTTAIAAVTMQNQLNEIAETIAVDIRSTRVLKPSVIENSDFMLVSVQVSLELTVRKLKRFLYKLESGKNILQVTKLRLRKGRKVLPITLQTNMTITGLMQKPLMTEGEYDN